MTNARLETVDIDKFQALARAQVKRLSKLRGVSPEVDRITIGRTSGIHLLSSFLEECVVKND